MVQLAVGTINPNSYTTQAQCRNGSKVTKLTLQLDIVDDSIVSVVDYYDWYVWFNIGGTQTRPTANAINSSTLKNQVFHIDGTVTDQIVFTAAGFGQPWKNSWRVEINIPRAWQQVNENDVIELVVLGGPNTAHSSVKVKCIYKEIFP